MPIPDGPIKDVIIRKLISRNPLGTSKRTVGEGHYFRNFLELSEKCIFLIIPTLYSRFSGPKTPLFHA